MPEFFRSRFHGRAGRVGYALLRAQERAATAFASAVLTVNDALGRSVDRARRPGGQGDRDPECPVADPVRSRQAPGPAVHGRWHAPARVRRRAEPDLRARRGLRSHRPDRRHSARRSRSASTSMAATSRRCRSVIERSTLGVEDRVTFHGRVPIEAVPAAIAAADVGLAPTRRSEFTDFSLSTKAYEYAAMGRTVVASRLPMVERIFGDDVVTYEPGDPDDLAVSPAAPRRRARAPGRPTRERPRARSRPRLGARSGALPRAHRGASQVVSGGSGGGTRRLPSGHRGASGDRGDPRAAVPRRGARVRRRVCRGRRLLRAVRVPHHRAPPARARAHGFDLAGVVLRAPAAPAPARRGAADPRHGRRLGRRPVAPARRRRRRRRRGRLALRLEPALRDPGDRLPPVGARAVAACSTSGRSASRNSSTSSGRRSCWS